MPIPEDGKTVEELYWDRVRAMSPTEKLRLAGRMNANTLTMVETQIRSAAPDLDDRALKFALVRRFYWDEPKILALLDTLEKQTELSRKAGPDE